MNMQNDVLKNCSYPDDVINLITLLTGKNSSSFLVGGCVRDILMGKIPHDYDIATSLAPDDTCQILKQNGIFFVDAAKQYGTIVAVLNGEEYEITSYRKDTGYSDGRHPDAVVYANTIEEDLARRDFTINAMAYSPITDEFVDMYGGREDLKEKKIRCVGNPDKRFAEDALRIMRAARFATVFDFEIADGTFQAMKTNLAKLESVSAERITNEICKMAQSENFGNSLQKYDWLYFYIIPELKNQVLFFQNNPAHEYTLWKHTKEVVSQYHDTDLIINLAALFHDIGKPYCGKRGADGYFHYAGHGEKSANMAEQIMRRMKFDNKTMNAVCELVRFHDKRFEVDGFFVKKMLRTLGPEQFGRLLALREADVKGSSRNPNKKRLEKVKKVRELFQQILERGDCYKLSDLAVNGKDLIEAGMKPGKEIGDMLEMCLEEAMKDQLLNNKRHLLWFAKEMSEAIRFQQFVNMTNEIEQE